MIVWDTISIGQAGTMMIQVRSIRIQFRRHDFDRGAQTVCPRQIEQDIVPSIVNDPGVQTEVEEDEAVDVELVSLFDSDEVVAVNAHPKPPAVVPTERKSVPIPQKTSVRERGAMLWTNIGPELAVERDARFLEICFDIVARRRWAKHVYLAAFYKKCPIPDMHMQSKSAIAHAALLC